MDCDESRAITATTVLTGGLLGIGVVGGMSGITSSMGVKMDGVYSDFKCLVVRGVQHADGVYELYFAKRDKWDKLFRQNKRGQNSLQIAQMQSNWSIMFHKWWREP